MSQAEKIKRVEGLPIAKHPHGRQTVAARVMKPARLPDGLTVTGLVVYDGPGEERPEGRTVGDPPPRPWQFDAWTCVLTIGRAKLATTYRTGTGHRVIPTAKHSTYSEERAIKCADGYGGPVSRPPAFVSRYNEPRIMPTAPDVADVFQSLVSDAESAEFATDFREFAENSGMSADSIKGKKIYRACLKIAARLRRFMPAIDFGALREWFDRPESEREPTPVSAPVSAPAAEGGEA